MLSDMIRGGHQKLCRYRLETGVVEAVEHAADDVEFFEQHRQRFFAAQRRLSLALGISIRRERGF